jgi:hypothetical protein
MTACAMTIGMVPMALALEQGSQMQAPLGRAVIGGLIMSTIATLLVVPSIFALLMGGSKFRSPSLYPGDPESLRFDPDLAKDEVAKEAEEEKTGDEIDPIAEGPEPALPNLFEHWGTR